MTSIEHNLEHFPLKFQRQSKNLREFLFKENNNSKENQIEFLKYIYEYNKKTCICVLPSWTDMSAIAVLSSYICNANQVL